MADQSLDSIIAQGQATNELFERQGEEKRKPPFEWSSQMTKEGQTIDTLKLPRELTRQVMEDLRWKNETMGAFEQELGRLNKQQQSGSPILDVLATVSGELAAGDKRLPPLVSALGRASLRLNPTQQEIADRKLSLLSAMSQMSSQQLEMGRQQERLGLERERLTFEEKKAEDTLQRQRLEKFNQRADIIAGKGGGPLSFDEYEGKARSYGIKDPEVIKDGYEAHVGAATVSKAALEAKEKQKIATAKEIANIKGDVRERVERDLAPLKFANAQRLQTNRIAEMAGLRKDLIEDRQANQEYEKVRPGVLAVVNMKDATGKLRQLISEHPEAVGVIEGRIPEYAITREQAQVRAEFFTLLDAVRQSISGGTRFWNPQEFKNLSPKLAMANKTERVNLGIMDALDDFAARGARNIVRTAPYAQWDKIGDTVWGQYKDEIFGSQDGSGAVSPTTPSPMKGKKTGQSGESETRRKDPSGSWWSYKDGKWVKE